MFNYHPLVFAFGLLIVSRWIFADEFNETLLIKPVASGHVVTEFKFDITSHSINGPHYHLWPRHLSEVLVAYGVAELQLSLTAGRWQYDRWLYSSTAAPAGAHLIVWFQPHVHHVQTTWKGLVNALSGMFCASLNFMDASSQVSPRLSYRPQGVVGVETAVNNSLLIVSSLPREAVCTENLTPIERLLPCGSKAGLATLLSSQRVFGSEYQTLTVNYHPLCSTPACTGIYHRLSVSVTAVFDTSRLRVGAGGWSLHALFGSGVFGACGLATASSLVVDTTLNHTQSFYLRPAPPSSSGSDNTAITHNNNNNINHVVYNVSQLTRNGAANVRFINSHSPSFSQLSSVPLTVTQYQTGSGLYRVGINVELHNSHTSESVPAVVLLAVPWYVRLFYHTLTVRTLPLNTLITPVVEMAVPAVDRARSQCLELRVTVPPGGAVVVAVQARRGFLRWHEYPPDASHGFYVPAAVISALLPTANDTAAWWSDAAVRQTRRTGGIGGGGRVFVRLYTENLLVSLATPDFSMPYNVICLVCTCVALAFGPLHNITTKRLVMDCSVKQPLMAKLKTKLQSALQRIRPQQQQQQQQQQEQQQQQ